MIQFINGNALHLPFKDKSIQCCITSPPYWALRDYGVEGQLGLEKTPEEFIENMVLVFREVWRVLRNDGTLWINIGDCYSGSGKGNNPNGKQGTNVGTCFDSPTSGYVPNGCKPKDLIGIPWMLAFALRADGWYLRQDIIWHKPNPMPESVTDRCTKAHEYVFLLTKNKEYYYDAISIKEESLASDNSKKRMLYGRYNNGNNAGINGNRKGKPDYLTSGGKFETTKRNKRSVWTITTESFPEAHFATFPEELVEPMILAGCPESELVLDPFSGSGTVGAVCLKHNRNFVGIELNPEYIEIAKRRIEKTKGISTKPIIVGGQKFKQSAIDLFE